MATGYNPYSPPLLSAEKLAEPVGPRPRGPSLVALEPRVWTALTVGAMAILSGLVVSAIAIHSVAMAKGPEDVISNPEVMRQWLTDFGSKPDGFLYLVLPTQLVLLCAAVGAASLSREPFLRRLGLVRSSLPLWSIPILIVATPFVGMTVHVLFPGLASAPNTQLNTISQIIRSQTGMVALFAMVCVTILPGYVEEMLFRGYVQRRLLMRWHPLAAIGLTTMLFAAAHVDAHYMLAVLPLGMWLGVLAWRSGSIWPGIICHMVNNFVAFCFNRFTKPADSPADLSDGRNIMLAVCGIAFAVSVVILYGFGRDACYVESESETELEEAERISARLA